MATSVDSATGDEPVGRSGGATNVAIFSAVTEMKGDLATLRNAFETFRANLSDAYMPRREAETNNRELRDRVGDLHSRLTAMEEWRLSETRQASERQQALQTQIQTAIVAGLKDDAGLRVATASLSASGTARDASSRRQSQIIWSVATILIASFCNFFFDVVLALVGYLLTHH